MYEDRIEDIDVLGSGLGKVERGGRVSETRSGRDGEEALASMGYRASLDIVEERTSATHCRLYSMLEREVQIMFEEVVRYVLSK